jgi:hypothetical protein
MERVLTFPGREDDSGTGRFTIGITSQDGITYHHVHLSATQARRFVDFMDEST